MTLIVALLNQKQVILVSDRRFATLGTKMVDDEQNKLATLVCNDGRAVVAFTGIARTRNFETAEVLLDAFADAGKPDHWFLPTIGRVAGILTDKLSKLKIPANKKSLTVVVAGYHYPPSGPPKAVLFKTTNDATSTGKPTEKRDPNRFVIFRRNETDKTFGVTGLYGFGTTAGVSTHDRTVLTEMMLRDAPASGLVDKTVDMIRNAAESPESRNLVGKQCSSIILPVDTSKSASADYHSMTVGNRTYMPNAINSTTDAGVVFKDFYVEQLDQRHYPPLVVPKVGRNKPCPCGSGQKFKRCCGPRIGDARDLQYT